MHPDPIESRHEAQIAHLPNASIARKARTKQAGQLPRAPRTLDDTGLNETFVASLVLKSTLIHGRSDLGELVVRHRLPIPILEGILAFLTREHLIEITGRGATDIDVSFRLTDAGRELAIEEKSRGSYCGPAPVTFDDYVESVAAHSVRDLRITQANAHAAFAGIVIDPIVLDSAAAALNAGRPLMIHGPAGSGKTYLAERLGTLLYGSVPVPHAIYAGGEIIQIYDPLVHIDAPQDAECSATDRRWRLCRRPVILSGGELTLDELNLRRDATTGFYQAPPHVKANMGLYIVDDLGRQRAEPRDLLNRWIVPLDRDIDLLTLATGSRIVMPFDVWPVFSSNLSPAELGDEAFARRLGSKLHVGPLSVEHYRALFDAKCASLGLSVEPDAFDYLLHHLHLPTGKPFLACYPGDLLRLVSAAARYRNDTHTVTADGLHDAWRNYFGAVPEQDGHLLPPERTLRSRTSG